VLRLETFFSNKSLRGLPLRHWVINRDLAGLSISWAILCKSSICVKITAHITFTEPGDIGLLHLSASHYLLCSTVPLNETCLSFLHSINLSLLTQIPLNTAAAMIQMRLVIIFLTITWLALASLSSATARFAVVLRD
jgi:hypothetical protein